MKGTLLGRLRTLIREERGSAMVVTILVMVVLTGMGAVVFVVGTNNIQNAGRDRLAAGAFGASEGGVAQALQFIRTSGASTLLCDDPPVAGTDCTQPWGSANPKVVTLSGNKEYNVWIQRVQGFSATTKVGTYRIHSTGTAGTGRGRRLVDVTVSVTPFRYPIGVYADTITQAGTPILRKESMFSQGCITGRDKINFEGIDPYHGIPSAAHSTQYTSDKVNGACSAGNEDNIHYPKPDGDGVCNSDYPYDQDRQGEDLTGTSCYASPYPTSSFFGLDDLKSYGYEQPRGLTDAQYAELKSKAQEQGTYFTEPSYPSPTDPLPYLNAVYYFEVGSKDEVKIQDDLNMFGSAFCGVRSIVIVVQGGEMHVNAGADIVGAVFVPDGNYQGNGNALVTGTLFAKEINKLNGTADFSLEGPTPDCFFNNFPGGLMEVSITKFQEVDRPLVLSD